MPDRQNKRPDPDFIPFGAQYYRNPTPLPSEWEKDLRQIQAHGFNTIKIWVQWRTNNPRENVYAFGDIESLMDLAAKYGLRVIINIILDAAPAWFFKKYPESVMENADGTRLAPMTTEYRQAGGAPGPCYHHPDAIREKRRFVEKLAERFAGHPALYIWDLWNEPELTCGIARQPSESKMACYCAHSRNAFIGWLAARYGTAQALNKAWKSSFAAFDEVELPRNPGSFKDMIDWRVFFAETLTADLEERVKAVRAHDARTPVMVHTVPPPHFNMINACADDYALAKLCDLFGNSIGSSAFPATLSVCSAKNKPVINAEIHALGGGTFSHPCVPTYDQLKAHIFIPLSKGIRGFVFWQYRPELLGRESPAWGLTDREGNATAHLETVRRINGYLQANRDFFCRCRPVPARIAVIKDNYNELFAWCADGTAEKYLKSLTGAYRAFQDANFNVDIITADQLLEEDISAYRLLYYPLPYYMSAPVADRLRGWTAAGGTLVSECFFGGYRSEVNLHSVRVPGYGFDDAFGIREGRTSTAAKFLDAYGENGFRTDIGSLMTPISYTALSGERLDINGYYFCEELTGGDCIGVFSNRMPAVAVSSHGSGQGIFIGSLTGAAYETEPLAAGLAFFADLALRAGLEPEATASLPGVRVDRLEDGGGRLLVILSNGTGASGEVRVRLAAPAPCDTLEDMEGNRIPVSRAKDGAAFGCALHAFEVKVLLSPKEAGRGG